MEPLLLGWGGRAGAGRRRVASGWACTPWWPSAGAEGCCVVLWPGPKEPPCVAGVSGGRGGSPIAVPERPPAGGGVRWCSGTAIARASVMLTVGGWGEWPGPPGRVRARAGRAAVPGLPWPGNPGCRRYRRSARCGPMTGGPYRTGPTHYIRQPDKATSCLRTGTRRRGGGPQRGWDDPEPDSTGT